MNVREKQYLQEIDALNRDIIKWKTEKAQMFSEFQKLQTHCFDQVAELTNLKNVSKQLKQSLKEKEKELDEVSELNGTYEVRSTEVWYCLLQRL